MLTAPAALTLAAAGLAEAVWAMAQMLAYAVFGTVLFASLLAALCQASLTTTALSVVFVAASLWLRPWGFLDAFGPDAAGDPDPDVVRAAERVQACGRFWIGACVGQAGLLAVSWIPWGRMFGWEVEEPSDAPGGDDLSMTGPS